MPPKYPDKHLAGDRCNATLDCIAIDANLNKRLGALFATPFDTIVASLIAYVNTPTTYVHANKKKAVRDGTAWFVDAAQNPHPSTMTYKDILMTKESDLPPDIRDVSACCIRNGIYLPHNHVRDMDKPEIAQLFKGEGIYVDETNRTQPLGFFAVQFVDADPVKQLGDVFMAELYTTPIAHLTKKCRFYMSEAKRLGILRTHRHMPLVINPKQPDWEPGNQDGIGSSANDKCCLAGVCVNGLKGQYCGPVSSTDLSCNSQSDPC